MSHMETCLARAALFCMCVLLGCGDGVVIGGSNGDAGTGGSTALPTCGSGPVDTWWGDCPEPLPIPRCPEAPEAGYVPLVGADECDFTTSQDGCEPVHWATSCVSRDTYENEFYSSIGGLIGLVVAANDNGSFDVDWRVESTNDGEVTVTKGHHTLPSGCCEITFDIPVPGGAHRYRIQTDWEPLP